MCGVFGWVGADSATSAARSRAPFALAELRNRGPDGHRLEIGPDWLLGHTRLAILDLTERASQPMSDGHGHWLAFNGEVYNFQQLRSELEAEGIGFRSTGDSEVVLAAVSRWGTAAFRRLRGMFAFAWLDSVKREMFLVRDRYGVKPLVWEPTPAGVQFASSLFALDAVRTSPRRIDGDAARAYLLLGYVPAPATIWQGPRKLQPGCYLHVRWTESGELTLKECRYWSLAEVPLAGEPVAQDLGEQFESGLVEALRLRLISDVPLGLLLSGGVDSTLLAAACSAIPGAQVPAFTMGFEESASDERLFARAVAKQLGLTHQDFVAESADIASLFEDAWCAFDEPFADSSALPMLLLCREIRRRVKVAIGGDGGDEVWCGYPWHRALDRIEHAMTVPHPMRRLVSVASQWAGPHIRYQARVLAARDRLEAWSLLRTGITTRMARYLPIQEPLDFVPRDLFLEASRLIGDNPDPLDWACRMDLAMYLPDDLMVKADRASMHVGLELREPLLDHEFTRWGLGQPVRVRYDREKGQGKQLARRYLASRLVADLMNQRKQGFTPPLPAWLDGPLRDRKESALTQLRSGDLAPLALSRFCRSWSQNAKRLADTHQQFLWRVICFAGWKSRAITRNVLGPLSP